MTEKGGACYDCLTRVPLIVAAPGLIPENRRDSSFASLVDIVPTLLRLQGLEVPRSMQGEPLPTATDAQPRDCAFSEYGAGGPPFTVRDLAVAPPPWGYRTLLQSLRWREAEGWLQMVRTADWKLVHDPAGGGDELYDLQADPWELDNRFGDPAGRGVAEALLGRIERWGRRLGPPVPVPLPEPRLVDEWPAQWSLL